MSFRAIQGALMLALVAAEAPHKKIDLSKEPMLTGGALGFTWKDCGSVGATVTDLQPTSLTLGDTTAMSASVTTDKDISGGTWDIKVSAGFLSLGGYSGDVCEAKTIDISYSMGSVDWKGLTCPVAAGPTKIDLDMSLSSSIPSSLARVTISMTVKDTQGNQVLCAEIHTFPGMGKDAPKTVPPQRELLA
mmetsp:Transcript_20389/g.44467  ORF Transcript_20389/g.44467 Transcript_20389/m.44467 type:complete len:190 (+) Transcript_20389:72-641(+)|eukprot:CAMPEP_0206510904 /NCGR_PEP_ID=MMETSP0324_2-20121206/59965_1 /ASSEMBLY_ACC=CAM_ASM_000836 /TAXON_ID=2866 /ORGANISM="Crypthecodinium cohnii, Strain Seligo" /LENGTH=189 /DNA_ID=CAMNT_0054002567 /DNA_START=72 /DNA_END=641 /DNA_ORIENTATION=+